MDLRYPIYQEADITVQSRDVRKEQVAGDVLAAIAALANEGTIR
jgi:shikimate kinase